MRKIIALILVVMLIVAMTVPAYAANIVPIDKIGTNFKMPTIKTVDISYSTVYENAKTAIQSNIVNNIMNSWFKVHPMI